jgi:hypothetical protein
MPHISITTDRYGYGKVTIDGSEVKGVERVEVLIRPGREAKVVLDLVGTVEIDATHLPIEINKTTHIE